MPSSYSSIFDERILNFLGKTDLRDKHPALTIIDLLDVVLVLIPLLLIELPPPLIRRNSQPLLSCGEKGVLRSNQKIYHLHLLTWYWMKKTLLRHDLRSSLLINLHWDILTTIWWIDNKFRFDIPDSQRMKPSYFDTPVFFSSSFCCYFLSLLLSRPFWLLMSSTCPLFVFSPVSEFLSFFVSPHPICLFLLPGPSHLFSMCYLGFMVYFSFCIFTSVLFIFFCCSLFLFCLKQLYLLMFSFTFNYTAVLCLHLGPVLNSLTDK